MTKKAKIKYDVLKSDMELVADAIEDFLHNNAQFDQRTDRILVTAMRMLRNATHIVIHEHLPVE